MVALLFSLAVYWALLHDSHVQMREHARADSHQLASQTSHALALHFGATVDMLDHLTRQLGFMWLQSDPRRFDEGAGVIMTSLAAAELAQVAIADAEGTIRYSRLADKAGVFHPAPQVSIFDREHFRVHAKADHSFFFISKPVKGRISQQWTIQFTRGIWRDGAFEGVIVLSVSADYLAAALKEIFPNEADAASLISSSGTYLARSYHLEKVLGKVLPDSREFITRSEKDSGTYQLPAEVDGIDRLYSWHRVTDHPLIVIVGQGTEESLDLANAAIRDSHWQSGVGSGLLLLGGLMVAWLWGKGSVQASRARTISQRLEMAVEGGHLGAWDYRLEDKQLIVNPIFKAILDLEPSTPLASLASWEALIHPQDRPYFTQAFRGCVDDGNPNMTGEYRMLGAGQRNIHVVVHGRVVERDGNGRPSRIAGTLSDISAHVAETRLREVLLNQSSAAILFTTPGRRFIQANAKFYALFLPPDKDASEWTLRDLHIDETHWLNYAQYYVTLRERGSVRTEFPFRDAEGRERWFDVHAVLQDADDPESGAIWTLIDVTSRHEALAALSVETSRLTALLHNFPGGVLIEDAFDKVAFVNGLWPVLLGLPHTTAQLQGLHDKELRALLGPRISSWIRPARPLAGDEARHLREVTTDEGRHLEVEHLQIENDEYLGSLWLVLDITDRKQRELALAHLAATDALTGLPNRRSFMQAMQLQSEFSRLDQQNTSVVLMLDIDHFKKVNDSYGHAVGDVVLQDMARILRENVRPTDTPGRLGGEEFTVLLPRTGIATGLEIAERIRMQVEGATFEADGRRLSVTISIGVSLLKADMEPGTALKQADDALYRAKQAGRNRVCNFGAV